MKNSKNDNFTLISTDSYFTNMPTSAEAEQMEAAAPDAGTFSETKVANLALEKLQKMQSVKSAPSHSGRRRYLRITLIAACVAVFLLGTVVAAAKTEFNTRIAELLGLKEPAKELVENWYEIGLTKEINGVEVTIVDAFGDSNNQWAELKTNLKFKESVPDGFVTSDKTLFPGNLSLPRFKFTNPDSNAISFGGYTMICMPFARDGYLWYLLYFTCRDLPINEGYFTLMFDMHVGDSDAGSKFEFRWNCKYDSHEEIFTINKPAGRMTVTEVRLSPTCLTVYAEKTSSDEDSFRIDSVTLADGTVYPAKATILYGLDGGRWTESPDSGRSYSFARYLLIPNHSFDTPEDMTSMIPAGEIIAVTVDGVTIPIR